MANLNQSAGSRAGPVPPSGTGIRNARPKRPRQTGLEGHRRRDHGLSAPGGPGGARSDLTGVREAMVPGSLTGLMGHGRVGLA